MQGGNDINNIKLQSVYSTVILFSTSIHWGNIRTQCLKNARKSAINRYIKLMLAGFRFRMDAFMKSNYNLKKNKTVRTKKEASDAACMSG